MKSAYRVIAYVIAAEVAVQSAAIVMAIFGLLKWIDGGATLNKAVLEADEPPDFVEGIGFFIHALNGMYLIPLFALILLIVSFFAKIPGGVKWAGFVFLAVLLQVALGLFAHGLPGLGALHGINALILFGLAVMAGKRVRAATDADVYRGEPARV